MLPRALHALLPSPAERRPERWTTWAVLLALAAGVVLRFVGLARRSIGAPEGEVLGLLAPATHLHPSAWHVGMDAWTALFGTGLATIRLPSAILGALSLVLVHAVARRLVDRPSALLATALLACSGLHVFDSQIASADTLACLLGLASTLLLLRLERAPRRHTGLAYAAVTALGLWTHPLVWPLLVGQMAWSALRSIRGRKPSVSLPWQIAALIAGTPVLALLMRSGPAALGQDSAAQFFDLGYAFLGSAHRFGPALEAPFPRIAVRLLTLGLFALGWFGRGKVPTAPATSTTEPVRPHFLSVSLTAGAMIAALGWLAPLSPHVDRETILFLALLPLGIGMATRWIDRVLGWVPYAWTPREPPLDLVLGIVPIVLVGIVGELLGIRFATGTVVFLPYLLIGVANGVAALARARVPRAIPVAALILVQIASLRFHGQATVDDVDYRGLAQAMAPTVRADDLVLASDAPRARPLLQGASLPPDHFVLRDQDSVLRARPGCRAWVILFDDPEDVPLLDVVRGYRSVLEVRAHGVRAILFELPRRLNPAPGPGEIAPPLG